MQRVMLVKIGGQITDDPRKLQRVLGDFSRLPGPKLLVHGGGRVADSFLQKQGIVPRMAGGRRITDGPTLEVIQMVYAGLLNKNIVAGLQALDCPAFGLSGVDGNAILAQKRPVADVDFGLVGDVQRVDAELIKNFLELNLIPVFCALTHDGEGQILNTNADTIASEIAAALTPYYEVELFYLFDKRGVLRDPMQEDSTISEITSESYRQLKEKNIIKEGMKPKMDTAFSALKKGVGSVHLMRYDALGYPRQGTRVVL